MRKTYLRNISLLIGELLLVLAVISCRKDPAAPNPTPVNPAAVNYAKIGLYELVGGTNRRIFLGISQVGTQKVNYASIFDTGSTGMTIDATGVLPASMITTAGLQVPGDSITVNGITVTSQQSIITYGDQNGSVQEYGNLAYAPITISDPSGNVTTPRIPIFIYYKIVDVSTGQQLPAHSNDVFGVGAGVSFTNPKIASPLSYFKLPAGVTNGYRIAKLSSGSFSTTGTFVPSLLYIGLTANDINSSNFVMHPMIYNVTYGYLSNINSSITYNGQSIAGTILFDTGTPSITTIENNAAPANSASLATGSTVSITTSKGFSYQYTTTADYNLTQVKRPSYSGESRTIFSIDFFLDNEFLMDYGNNQIGLKNN